MRSNDADVVIVGGGPAGLAAGIVCSRNGLKTILVEQKTFPVTKPCGQGILPSGRKHLHSLGVTPFLENQASYEFSGIRYIAGSGNSAEGLFREGCGLGISRARLSQAMLAGLKTHPDVEVLEKTIAEPVSMDREGAVLKIGGEKVRAGFLIGADGLSSRIRRWAGLDGTAGSYQRWGATQHFFISPWSEFVEVYWSQGLEAYLTPLGEDMVGLAFLGDMEHFRKSGGKAELISNLLSMFPALKMKLDGARLAGKPGAVGPLQRNARKKAAGRLLLLGDAAGYLDAITGEGISLALAQALAFEQTIVPQLKDGNREPGSPISFSAHRRAHQHLMRPYLLSTRLALFISKQPGLQEAAVQLLKNRPQLFERLLSASMGRTSFWPVIVELVTAGFFLKRRIHDKIPLH
jgi:menaquinone-9 beta-reductase